MDPAAFKLVTKAYNLISTKREKLTDSEISYVLGLIEGAIQYSTADPENEPEKVGMLKKLGL